MTEPTICPLISDSTRDEECVEEKCALWRSVNARCAFYILPTELADIGHQLYVIGRGLAKE